MPPNTSLDTTYAVANKDVTLTIFIGDGQIGDSVVFLGSKNITPVDTAHIRNLLVGNGPKLVGKKLSVKSIVSDVNDATNKTSIRYVLKGGQSTGQYDLHADVEEDGDAIIYRATFTFI